MSNGMMNGTYATAFPIPPLSASLFHFARDVASNPFRFSFSDEGTRSLLVAEVDAGNFSASVESTR